MKIFEKRKEYFDCKESCLIKLKLIRFEDDWCSGLSENKKDHPVSWMENNKLIRNEISISDTVVLMYDGNSQTIIYNVSTGKWYI